MGRYPSGPTVMGFNQKQAKQKENKVGSRLQEPKPAYGFRTRQSWVSGMQQCWGRNEDPPSFVRKAGSWTMIRATPQQGDVVYAIANVRMLDWRKDASRSGSYARHACRSCHPQRSQCVTACVRLEARGRQQPLRMYLNRPWHMSHGGWHVCIGPRATTRRVSDIGGRHGGPCQLNPRQYLNASI